MIPNVESARETNEQVFVEHSGHAPPKWLSLFPFAVLFVMEWTLLLLDAVLPLAGLKFYDVLLAKHAPWTLLPARLFFPGVPVIPVISTNQHISTQLVAALSMGHMLLLFCPFLVVFAAYILALRWLPQLISFRYILMSTLLLGVTCCLVPVATSSDLFSYIAYARMSVIHHLNPLTTLPLVIHSDPIYALLSWKDQPSAYGPAWIAMTDFLQRLLLLLGGKDILSMVLALRLSGLAAHLGSTFLAYAIIGRMQQLNGYISPEKRLWATLAFAWNPLLLLEACINAHNDTVVLFFILLSIWFLAGRTPTGLRTYLAAIFMLVIATCIKVNVVLLAPALLLYIWRRQASQGDRQSRPLNTPGASPWGGQHLAKLESYNLSLFVGAAFYVGLVVLFYTPFWQHGAALKVLQVNPGAYRNDNTLADFLSRFYTSFTYAPGYLASASSVTPAQHVAHILSMLMFMLLYALLCWQALRSPFAVGTLPGLLRWLALAWLLYCAIGSPWFWPWYTVTFFGLYALIEGTDTRYRSPLEFLHLPLAVRLLAFSMFSLYCFLAWGPTHLFIPGLPGFHWSYLSGLWAWVLPLLALRLPLSLRVGVRNVGIPVPQTDASLWGRQPQSLEEMAPIANALSASTTQVGALFLRFKAFHKLIDSKGWEKVQDVHEQLDPPPLIEDISP